MGDEQVIDASVIGAALFNEAGSEQAREFLAAGPRLIAPDLLRVEIASLAAKKIWRGEAPVEAGRRALAALPDFIAAFVSGERLAPRAFELAAEHRFSAYDALYLALAETRAIRLVSLDKKLIRRAAEVSLSSMVGLPFAPH